MKDDLQKQDVVMIVDDDAATRLLMRKALKDINLDIYEAVNGEQAIELFEKLKPDLTLLDVSMPGIDGFTCCQRLRSLPNAKYKPIVMVTGHDEASDIELAFHAGATDFMTKPLKWPLFSHRVRYILQSHKNLLELGQNRNKLATAQSIAHLAYWEWDFESSYIDCSNDMHDMLGVTSGNKLTFARVLKAIHPDDRERFKQAIRSAVYKKQPYDIEYKVLLPSGRIMFINERAEISHEFGKPLIVGTLHDITSQKESQQEVTYYAYYDTLTDLPNRRLFIEQLESSIVSARHHGQKFTLMYVDLDRFKQVNDSYGHQFGDRLLCLAAERINDIIQDLDWLVTGGYKGRPKLARLAGDEFAILLEDLFRVEHVAQIANRLIQAFSVPFVIDDFQVHITISVGMTVYPTDGLNAQSLMKNVDMAVVHAKGRGQNHYQFFSETMNSDLKLQVEVEHDLRNAFNNSHFILLYQPLYEQNGSKIVGFEALLRLNHPHKGLLLPAEFLDVAESSGLILKIGEWVLREACQQIKRWQLATGENYRVSVNLSALQFNQKYLPQQVLSALQLADVEPECLELEITETSMLKNEEETAKALQALKDIGVRLAIDDFGTGYSSMSYLKNLPVDTIKIDKSFVDEIVHNIKDAAITQTIIQLANNLGLRTVAEGVESAEQATSLVEMGIDEFQGFYFNKPLAVEQVSSLII